MRTTLTLSALALLGLSAATAGASPANLVPNGDFSGGNTGFSSGYAFSPGSNTAEGQYTVRTNPSPWNGFFVSMGDRTTGTGNMFVGNGAPTAGQIVWESGPIAVAAGTNYFFEAFVANVCCTPSYTGGNSAPILDFAVSLDGGADQALASRTIPVAPAGVWYGVGATFNSGAATSVVLRLVNANTDAAGNDFALDDVFLGTRSSLAPVPAPAALALFGLGLAGLVAARRQVS